MTAVLAERTLLEPPPTLTKPNMLFQKDRCFWPSRIGLKEKFTAKWLVVNQSTVDGRVWLGLSYKGKDYVFHIEGHNTHVPLKAGHAIEFQLVDATIEELFKEIETFEKSKTLEINFLTGYFLDNKYYATDNWPVTTYVEVPRAGLPSWAIWATAGGLVLVGLVMLARRK